MSTSTELRQATEDAIGRHITHWLQLAERLQWAADHGDIAEIRDVLRDDAPTVVNTVRGALDLAERYVVAYGPEALTDAERTAK